jgi:hypothetical protein
VRHVAFVPKHPASVVLVVVVEDVLVLVLVVEDVLVLVVVVEDVLVLVVVPPTTNS